MARHRRVPVWAPMTKPIAYVPEAERLTATRPVATPLSQAVIPQDPSGEDRHKGTPCGSRRRACVAREESSYQRDCDGRRWHTRARNDVSLGSRAGPRRSGCRRCLRSWVRPSVHRHAAAGSVGGRSTTSSQDRQPCCRTRSSAASSSPGCRSRQPQWRSRRLVRRRCVARELGSAAVMLGVLASTAGVRSFLGSI